MSILRKNTIFFLIIILLSAGCKFRQSQKTEIKQQSKADSIQAPKPKVNAINEPEIIESNSNMFLTVNMSEFFLYSDAIFDKNLLNPYENYTQYQLSYSKALNFGVYFSDFVFTTVYQQFGLGSYYLQSMAYLANELGTPYQLLSNALVQGKNSTDYDSLVKYGNIIYWQTNQYIDTNELPYISLLITTGGWIESMYLAIKVAEQTASNDVISNIVKQDSSLGILVNKLSIERSNPKIKALYEQLIQIKPITSKLISAYPHRIESIRYFNEVKDHIFKLRYEIIESKTK